MLPRGYEQIRCYFMNETAEAILIRQRYNPVLKISADMCINKESTASGQNLNVPE